MNDSTADREFVHARLLEATPAAVYAAIADPARLARWWGPAGFSSTFELCEFRPGGAWRFVLHGPDGTDYPNRKDFVDIQPPARIVFHHAQAGHDWVMTMTFLELGERTHVIWRMRFATASQADAVRALVVEKNEENLDRLAAVL